MISLRKVVIINSYDTLAKTFLIGSICSSIMIIAGFIIFWRFLRRHGHKTMGEVAPQLANILKFMIIAGIISSILGFIGIVLH